MRHCRRGGILLAAAAAAAAATVAATGAIASETIRYSYDARGRLVKVVRTDTAQAAVKSTTDYSYDKAGNRTLRETKTGQ